MRTTAGEKMDQHHLKLSRDGLSVGVKNRSNEQYVDQTQKYFVSAWKLHKNDSSRDKSKKN